MNVCSISVLRAIITAVSIGASGMLPACADVVRPHDIGVSAMRAKSSMKSAAPRKANGSGIEVQFRIDGTPRIGTVLVVSLGFEGIVPQAGASVRFAADPGLTLADTDKVAALLPEGALAQNETVRVIPTSEGLTYLHIFTTQNGVTSVSSIAIQVGTSASAKTRGDLQSTPDGDRIRTMPVQ